MTKKCAEYIFPYYLSSNRYLYFSFYSTFFCNFAYYTFHLFVFLRPISHPWHKQKYLCRFILSIEEETDKREGKGRHCCLGDILECHQRAWRQTLPSLLSVSSSLILSFPIARVVYTVEGCCPNA